MCDGKLQWKTVTLVPNTNYLLPETVTVTGASYDYSQTTGIITLSNPTGNISITASCPKDQNPSSYVAVLLDGDEDWKFNGTAEPNTYGYYVEAPNNVTGNSIYLRFPAEIATSVDELKAYLQANPITLYFIKPAN